MNKTKNQARRDIDSLELPEVEYHHDYEVITDMDYPKVPNFERMTLSEKINTLSEREFNALINEIVNDVQAEDFHYHVSEGYYDHHPKLHHALEKAFEIKKENTPAPVQKPKATIRRGMR